MEQVAYLTAILAGTFYMVASYRLLRLSVRTQQRPELLLAIFFACSGQWYLVFNLPDVLKLDAVPSQIEFVAEWVYVLGIVAYATFLRRVFRRSVAWGKLIMIAASSLVLLGAMGSSIGGGFSNSIADPWYWIEWIGYTIPCLWMSFEGFNAHFSARLRLRVGLTDASVANRFLLFGFFGLAQVGSCLADLYWASENSVLFAKTTLAAALLSGVEIASVGVLWLAFFPPRLYSSWVDRRSIGRPA